MSRKNSVIGLIVIIVVITVGALVYSLSQSSTAPAATSPPQLDAPPLDAGNLTITPPASLAELATEISGDYPELADMLNNPELGSVYKDFYITYQNFGQDAALAMAWQRGILNDNGDVVMVLVLDTTEDTADLIESLENEGVIVESSYQDRINLVIPIALILEQIEAEAPELIVE